MDISALLQMLQGGGGPNLQGSSGGISAPVAPQMAAPALQMPQFPGAGSNAGVQQTAMAARQALATPPPQAQPMGGMMGSSNPMMMAMMMQHMQNQNGGPPGQSGVFTPSMNVQLGSIGGQQLPDLNVPQGTSSATSGLGGFLHNGFLGRLFGG